MKPYLWKIGGEAGFGIMTTGLFFSKIASKLGFSVYDYVEYPSLIRGGHNSYDVLFSQEKERTLQKDIDCLVCLNKETYDRHKNRLHSLSFVIFDPDEFSINDNVVKIELPFASFIKELGGQIIMKNTIALGASMALLGSDLSIVEDLLKKQFQRKGEEITRFNISLAQKGFDYIKNHYKKNSISVLVKQKEFKEQIVASGNDMFSYGAVVADCRLYVAYPMTPSSSVLTSLASWQQKTGMVVRHAEDEISVINTALGGSFAGVRSAVGSSGGGFALMAESVSYAGIAEIPLVIFISSRPGPATGLPTWTEQGDLLFTVHSGHGEFPKIVLAPGDPEEMFELTLKAFDLADIYQTPVFVMSDMFLSESHYSLDKNLLLTQSKKYTVDKGKAIENVKGSYLRYSYSKDGISKRLIPGAKGYYYQANSYEHTEDSHTTEDALIRKKQVDKRNMKNISYLQKHFSLPHIDDRFNDSDYVFITWGSTKWIVESAMKVLRQKGEKVSHIHFTHIYPLDREKIRNIFHTKKIHILVEQNSQGQFGKLLQMETGIEIRDKILKYDGRPITAEEIITHFMDLKNRK